MDRRVRIWIIGSIAAVFSIASSVFNVIFTYHLSERPVLSSLRILSFVAFGISLLNLASIICFCTLYVKNLSNCSLGVKAWTWALYGGGVCAAVVSIAVSGVTLVWLTIRRGELPKDVLGISHITWLAIWFGMWGASGLLQIVLFSFLGLWTKTVLRSQRASRLDMDFGIRASMHDIRRSNTNRTHGSFASQDVTLNSPPRTPVSRGGSTTRRSSSTRIGPGSSRTKLMRPSARSSLENMPFPAGEAASIDSAFDDWDTSSVHHEMRTAIHSSPPVVRGLATIPGSRPESPANALDGPYLPESPTMTSSPPHAATSDTATAVGWSSSPRQPKSSPPSSPPNFSRPTSSHNTAKPPPKFQKFDPSMDDLIHPLFRPNSPHPPPIATAGTMVTASPMADQLLTPKTLARLRDNNTTSLLPLQLVQKAYAERVESTLDTDLVPDSPTLGSDALGSPGPSIVDEADLPPILPGFVLSAGSRSSLVEYGKRKSTKKDRPKSHLSGSS